MKRMERRIQAFDAKNGRTVSAAGTSPRSRRKACPSLAADGPYSYDRHRSMLYHRVGRRFVPIGSSLADDNTGFLFDTGDWLHTVIATAGGHRHCVRRLSSRDLLPVMRALPRLVSAIEDAIYEKRVMPEESSGWRKMPTRERRAWEAYRKALGIKAGAAMRMTERSLADQVEEGVEEALRRFMPEITGSPEKRK